MSIPPGRLIIASTENLRQGHAFQAGLMAGFTAAGFFARARVSSSPVNSTSSSKMRDLPARSAPRLVGAFFFVTACRCFIVSSIETGITHIRHRSCETTPKRRFSNEATYRATRRFLMSRRGSRTTTRSVVRLTNPSHGTCFTAQ